MLIGVYALLTLMEGNHLLYVVNYITPNSYFRSLI